MQLCLVRHATAKNVGRHGIPVDSQRPLSFTGRAEAAIVGIFLGKIGWIPESVITSPLVRTYETARIIASRLGVCYSPLPVDILEPGGNAMELAALMRKIGTRRMLAVGHMPDCTEITAVFIGSKDTSGLEFQKAGAALITFDGDPGPGSGHLEWILQPEQMKRQVAERNDSAIKT